MGTVGQAAGLHRAGDGSDRRAGARSPSVRDGSAARPPEPSGAADRPDLLVRCDPPAPASSTPTSNGGRLKARESKRPVRDSVSRDLCGHRDASTKRRFRPHVVVGSLSAKFAAREAREIVRFVAGMRGLESNEEDHARTRIQARTAARVRRSDLAGGGPDPLGSLLARLPGHLPDQAEGAPRTGGGCGARGRGGRAALGRWNHEAKARDRTPN